MKTDEYPQLPVMYGSHGCLTDDCPHWENRSCTTQSASCALGRTYTNRPLTAERAAYITSVIGENSVDFCGGKGQLG
jgi:hypothetical protein